jgi:hypothetical protein
VIGFLYLRTTDDMDLNRIGGDFLLDAKSAEKRKVRRALEPALRSNVFAFLKNLKWLAFHNKPLYGLCVQKTMQNSISQKQDPSGEWALSISFIFSIF